MNGRRILVVEDDSVTMRYLELRLRANGYEVASAADGVMALAMARRNVPDLVLLDIGLPGGDGFVVMDRMQKLSSTATVPIIVITGREVEGNRERATRAGARAFFQKPVDNHVLLSCVKHTIGDRAMLR